MAKVTSESAFEDSIEAHLLASGWLNGDPSGYDRGLGLDAAELVAFLEASQPDEWEQPTQRLGGTTNAKERVAKYVGDQLTHGHKTGETTTLFPRYHQWDAVQKLLAATKQAGPGTNRLVQHSAGSGKSNTIAWAAHHLSRLHTPSWHGELTDTVKAAGLAIDQPIFNKVIVITDRVVLDRQLQSTVSGFAHTPGTIVKIDEDSTQLRAALAGNTARIIMTTLQKFPVVAEHAGSVAGSRFAVIVDEAHSSTSGEAMKDMKRVLGGSSTLVAADADPLTVAEQAEAKIESETDDAVDLIASEQGVGGAGPLRVAAPDQPRAEGGDHLEHFRHKTAGKIGGRAKAMVVTRSRLHAVRYKQAIDAYIAAKGYDRGPGRIAALVAFSGTVVDPSDPTVSYTEPMMNGFGEGSCQSGSRPTSTRCWSSHRSTRPGSTNRCCTPCTST